MPFAPLGRGFLTGAVKRAEEYPEDDYRRKDPRYQGENFDANVAAAAIVRDIAARHGAQARTGGARLDPAPKPELRADPRHKRRSYLEENVAAADLKLSEAEMTTLSDALAPGKIAGPRYGAAMMATVDR